MYSVLQHYSALLTRQLRPRYEGQLTWIAEPICHSFRSLVRPHDYHHSGPRSDGQGRTERGRCLRSIFCVVCGEGGAVCRGPRPTIAFGPQRELAPARLVIHRTDLCQHTVKNPEGCIRGRLAYFFPQQH